MLLPPRNHQTPNFSGLILFQNLGAFIQGADGGCNVINQNNILIIQAFSLPGKAIFDIFFSFLLVQLGLWLLCLVLIKPVEFISKLNLSATTRAKPSAWLNPRQRQRFFDKGTGIIKAF